MEDVLEFTQDLVECVNNDTKVSFMFLKVLVLCSTGKAVSETTNGKSRA